MIKKNDIIEVTIIDDGINGEGIAKIDSYPIFINGAIKGEVVSIKIVKVLKNYAYGIILDFIKKSPNRVEPDCKTYNKCGGCNLRHISYEETLKIKQNKVQNLANKMLKTKVKVSNTIGMEEPYFYRNKAIYPISQDRRIGIYRERTHDIINIETCYIQKKESQELAAYVANEFKGSIYDEKTHTGLLRNIMVRQTKANKQMLVLVLNTTNKEEKDKEKQNKENELSNLIDIEKIKEKFKNVESIIYMFNNKVTNVVLTDDIKVIYGDEKIEDTILDYKFDVSPNSFFQVNNKQTELLYTLAIKKANFNNNDVLADLYCGTGTIGIIASKYVKKVYGIEIIKQAIENAKENAKNNNIDNIEFICGDCKEAFDKLLKENININSVIVDPPRKGLDENTVSNLNKLELEKLVYISCNPATLMRDLSMLEDKYDIKEIIPVDQFPYTSHVETVVLLSKANK